MAYEQKKYEQSEAVKKAADQLAAANAQKPGAYQSEYQPQLKDLASQIINRKDFQFDLNGDALYNQYKDRYVGLGQQAMMDTMGMASKMTGGYGNSYAQLAGQQSYQSMLQGLNDKVPELYQLALDRHNQQTNDLMNRYGLLNNQEQQDYDRYLSEYNLWNNDRNFLADMLNNERGFDYGAYRDSIADDQWKASFDEDLRRFNFANKLGEFAPAPAAYSGGGGGGGGGNPNPKPEPNPEPAAGPTSVDGETVTHNDMVKDVTTYLKNAIAAGLSQAEAQKNANLLAGEWYQEHGKWK